MQLLHYYVQKGWKIDDFLSEPYSYHIFYKASMEKAYEEISEAIQEGGA